VNSREQRRRPTDQWPTDQCPWRCGRTVCPPHHPAGKLDCDVSVVVFHSPVHPSNSLASITQRSYSELSRSLGDLHRSVRPSLSLGRGAASLLRELSPVSARKLFSYQRRSVVVGQFALLVRHVEQRLIASTRLRRRNHGVTEPRRRLTTHWHSGYLGRDIRPSELPARPAHWSISRCRHVLIQATIDPV